MQVVLVMFRQNGEHRSFSITKDVTVIGRREDCDLRIPLSEVSRKHCRLVRDGEEMRVEDLGSSNGTYHNGRRIQETSLEPGDTVQIGSLAFVVQVDNDPPEDHMRPILAGATAGALSTPDADDLNPTAQSEAADASALPAQAADSGIVELEAGDDSDDVVIDLEESEPTNR
jgi:pSer/pThr/pTyr-binding forkhead associated (FHA) protein